MADVSSLREKGNEHFKSGRYEDALSCYMQALGVGHMKDLEKAVVFKNKAACHLKMGNNLEAIQDSTKSLELSPNDPKALYRRCQAYDNSGKLEEAYKDVVQLMKVDPQNKAALPLYNKLNRLIQEKIKQQNSTSEKVSQMFNISFDPSCDHEKRVQALNNLIVLAREEVGAAFVVKAGGLSKLKSLLSEKNAEIVQWAIRVLATLTKGSKARSEAIIREIGMPTLLKLLSADTEEMASSVSLLIQNLITYYTSLDQHQKALKEHEENKKKGERKPFPRLTLDDASSAFLDEVFKALVKMLINAKVTAYGRDAAMELITRNVTSKDGVDWTKPFLDTEGVENLLTVAGAQKEFKTLPITEHSSMHASVALAKIYDDLINDKLREKFKEKCHEYFRELFTDDILESKIEAVAAISTLLQGPYEVGGMLLGLEGVTQLMFTLADSENPQYQRVAVEAIVNSAQKKEKCSGLLKDAVPILKKLYKSGEDHIKVRALVGLCKLGSFMGSDASSHSMAEGSTAKLARICRRFLVSGEKDSDLRKWATEGLAYLTLDADIKEELVEDIVAIKSIFDLAKESDRNTTYASVTVLVNLTNSYDKQDVMPELLELAKYAKQHVPEEHAKDKSEFLSRRIHRLAEAGVVSALVQLSDTDSQNCRELLCRVYMSLATEENLRGLIVQQGGVKSILNLINNNTDNGSILAAHALAKIAVTSDPHFAFPGQRIYEVVRPLLSLLHADRSGLQNFEALMGLTNLSSVSETVRNRILTEKGVASIEHYMYEEHAMLRRAATECMCNMVMSEKVQELFEGENDRVKILVLFAGEEDTPLVRASLGALAVLSARTSLCHKIVKVKPWLDILQVHTVSELPDIQHRACHIVMNIVAADKDLATLVVESPMLEILMAVAKHYDPKAEQARKAAESALKSAVSFGLIKESQEGKAPDQFLEILRAQLRKAREEEEKKREAEEKEEENKRQEEEEEKKKAFEEYAKKQEKDQVDEEQMEEIVVEKQEEEETRGPKIVELTDEEATRIEYEEKEKKERQKQEEINEKTHQGESGKRWDDGKGGEDEEDIDEEELNRGDVWKDEKNLPQ